MNKNPSLSEQQRVSATKVVVASTVMLSFISFWRAAAIVLNDLGSSVYYVGGIAEQAIGRSAPWFIVGVMLFSYAVRSIYMESSSMFVRGGVYVVVRDAMGPSYPELVTDFDRIHRIAVAEETAFNRTLASGSRLFDDAARATKARHQA